MLRMRRLPPTRVLRRPVYEIEAGPSDEHPSGWTKTTTTPATLIDTQIGVAEAWALVDAVDAAWTGGVGPWVNPDGVASPESDAEGSGPSGDPLAGREFRLWELGHRHGGVLIRSPKGHGHDTNVDLVFDKVDYLSCPRTLPDLALVHADPADLDRVAQAVGEVEPPARVFVLVSQGARHLVVAASCRVIEHVGDPTASPFDPTRFSRDWWSEIFNGR